MIEKRIEEERRSINVFGTRAIFDRVTNSASAFDTFASRKLIVLII